MRTILLLILTNLCALNIAGQIRQSNLLNPGEQKTLIGKVKSTVEQFESNCNSIANKAFTGDKMEVIKNTLSLFDDHRQRYIEISGISNKRTYPRIIRDYLIRLKALPYISIKIRWANVSMTNEFKPSAEMNEKYHTNDWYEGVAVVIQEFDAVRNEMTAIKDTTKRIIKVYARKQEIYIGSEVLPTWVIKLGDIKVGETSSKIYKI